MNSDSSRPAEARPGDGAALDPRLRDLARVLGRVIARRHRREIAERRKAVRRGGEDAPKETNE